MTSTFELLDFQAYFVVWNASNQIIIIPIQTNYVTEKRCDQIIHNIYIKVAVCAVAMSKPHILYRQFIHFK